jgi:exosortase
MILPIPGWILDQMTGPLKQLASLVTTDLLQLFGVPIIREGVILYVDQYQLLVEDACAGLNALMGLTALGLFYAYLAHGPSWKYSALLLLFIVPIAVVANVVRIIILVILTIWGGNEAAQGYLHGAAGLVMFTAALVLVFALDNILSRGLPPPSASLAT